MFRRLRDHFKSGVHSVFRAGQRAGLDILPHHFYSSIPDIRELERTESWKRPSSMVGVNGADVDRQLTFLRDCCSAELQARLRRGGIHEHACQENGEAGYGVIEADVLFCFIASKRPEKIVQVGCGVSTAVILLAAHEAGYQPDIVCIEPYPNRYLRQLEQRHDITLLTKRAQDVDLDVLTRLEAGDLLFIDSTHTVKPGSEVNRIILEVLPRMVSRCFVHFHDIYFPFDYQSTVLTTLFFGGESTLLHAFLIDNARYAIAVSLSMLHHARPQEMRSVLSNYTPAIMRYGLHTSLPGSNHFPSAIYLSVI